MTAEEFNALLKLRDTDLQLVIESKLLWTVLLKNEKGAGNYGLWAMSENKEEALETLAKKFFGDDDEFNEIRVP